MTKTLRFLAALLVAVPVFAQAQQRSYSQPELDQMLAPIALYPDALLSQVLMAATYPIEVVEAARWSRANPGLQGDDAVRAVQDEDWDPSVKSLVAFPQVLQRMDEKLEWTRSLGDAFLAQEPQVLDTVQQLRRRAQAAGNLQSGEHLYVQHQGQTIVIQPASPQYVYVPYYDPMVVYGPWWWSAYRPVYWAPWPRPYAVRVSIGFFFGDFDWHRRQVRVVHNHNHYYRPPVAVNRAVIVETNRWQHDPHHRRVERQAQQRVQESQRHAQERVQESQRHAQQRAQEAQRQAHESQRQAQQQAQRQAQEAQRQAQQQARQRTQEAQRESRQERRANMPAAQAPQTPRAERQEQREERREKRQEQRKDRGKG